MVDDVRINSELTSGEDVADLGGTLIACLAWKKAVAGRKLGPADGFTPEQRFYLGWAQAWRSKAREPALRNAILTGVHAPGRYRAETVRNQDSWYPAFDVKPGQGRYLAPEQRVKVW